MKIIAIFIAIAALVIGAVLHNSTSETQTTHSPSKASETPLTENLTDTVTQAQSTTPPQPLTLVNECFDAHQVTYHTSQLGVMGQISQNSTTEMQGLLYSRHWHEGTQRFSIFMIQNITFNAIGESALNPIFEQPFLAQRDELGFFSNLYFTHFTSEQDEPILRGLILPFQSSEQIGTHETYDTLGRYSAYYSMKNQIFSKQKITYLETNNQQSTLQLKAQVSDSQNQYQYDQCWLNAHQGQEQIQFATQGSHQPFMSTAFHYALMPAQTAENPLSIYRGKTAQEILAQFHQGNKSTLSYQQKAAKQNDLKRVSSYQLTTDALINDLVNLKKSIGDYALYLQAHPDQLNEIIQKIITGETSSLQTQYLVELLALTGSKTAQQALVDISHASHLNFESRIQALAAFSSLQVQPTQATIQALSQYQNLLDSGTDLELTSTATLALGTLAQKTTEQNSIIREQVIHQLMNGLDLAKTPAAKRAQLLALSNARPNQLDSQTLNPYLTDADPSVRKASVRLLAQIANDTHVQTLLNHQTAEKDVEVRAEVFKQLSKVSLTAEQINYVSQASLVESDVKVRLRMIQLIGKNAENNNTLKQILNQLKDQETDENNFKQILKYL